MSNLKYTNFIKAGTRYFEPAPGVSAAGSSALVASGNVSAAAGAGGATAPEGAAPPTLGVASQG